MRPANMECHKLWWEWSRQRSHTVGIGEGMLRSIQAKGWGGCQCQGTPPLSVAAEEAELATLMENFEKVRCGCGD